MTTGNASPTGSPEITDFVRTQADTLKCHDKATPEASQAAAWSAKLGSASRAAKKR